jgi:signal transduction histidine kinase/CheY-like chemotaxis protein
VRRTDRLLGRISLRVFLLATLVGGGLYLSGFAYFLYSRMRDPAVALTSGTGVLIGLLSQLQGRHDTLHLAEERLRGILNGSSPRRGTEVVAVRTLAARAGASLDHALLDGTPPAVQVRIIALDTSLASAARLLEQAAAAAGAGDARRVLAAFDVRQASLDELMSDASAVARRELLGRQRAVQRGAAGARRDTFIWLGLGAVAAFAVAYVGRRRIWLPLAELQRGLTGVAEGDLTARLPERGRDEVGRLAALFNEMTRVLRDRAEEQGRFAAAGELVAGVAHEVNNPLMAIAAQAETRLGETGMTDEERDDMQQILRQARRASKLLRGLLRFVRAGEHRVTPVNLNDAVRGALDLVSYRFGVDEIEVTGTLDAQLPAVLGDPIRLEQVLVNLFSNAIDAMRQVPAPRRLAVDSWAAHGRVYVVVEDSGRGIPEEFADRLFKPFATTKGRRGTGLGLYISRQLIREAGGELTLESSAGVGARFVVSLPVTDQTVGPAPVPAGDSAAGGAATPLAGVRILLVDDEGAVRGPVVKFLSRRGATVLEAGDGEQALAQVAQRDVDLIVADLRMPRLGGVGLYHELQTLHPRLAERVLFLSGDISQLAEPGNTPVARERVLVKPVELRELEQRLLEVLREVSD